MRNQTFSVEIEANPNDFLQMKHYLNKWQPDFVSISNLSRYSYEEMVQCARYIQTDLKIPVVIHLTGLTHTKEQVKKAFNELMDLKIRNFLLVRGNIHHNMHIEDDFNYASDLIKYVNELDKDSKINVIAGCYPDIHFLANSLTEDIEYLKEKVNAGVDSLISLMCFDNDRIYKFIEKVHEYDINVPIRIGIMPITDSFKKHYLAHNDVTMPKFIKTTEDLLEDGIDFAVNQINDLYNNNVNGIHLYTHNDWMVSDRVYENIKHNL
ncbi:5,10-methylenetetrahydrofolate reductase [Apilactobacillus kunkeei]|nr:5,10-methylenetetrahydrofolate reductase [Apilactobacillus kunkeei]CAI2644386.1 5,10-methylenetetrahydrofolate reductase [Apilactobacillus kunkeei]CAI2803106.1 5,10-methylenetetrahydrofolate reductase [Apilactobacillus kunkeei]